jgi:hypothetical protein
MVGLIAGVIASVIHVVTGPDHLAAVTPLAISSRKRSWLVGLSWGIGHTLGMLAIGLVFIYMKGLLPVERISSHSEVMVGLLLIGIGTWAIIRADHRKNHRRHIHPHIHLKPHLSFHIHWHSHENQPDHLHVHRPTVANTSRAGLAVGIVHGVSGFSHLVAILPLLALPASVEAFMYLAGFAAGTIGAMVLVSFATGMIAHRSSLSGNTRFLYVFSLFAGILAVGTGIIWVIRSM